MGDAFLPYEPGVHAFYGLNGSGKTRLLDSLASIVLGERYESGFIATKLKPLELRREEDPSGFEDGLAEEGDPLAEAVRTALAGEGSSRAVEDAAAALRSGDPHRDLVRAFLESWPDLGVADLAIAEELAAEGWLLLRAGATDGEGGWVLEIGGNRGGDAPQLGAAIDELARWRDGSAGANDVGWGSGAPASILTHRNCQLGLHVIAEDRTAFDQLVDHLASGASEPVAALAGAQFGSVVEHELVELVREEVDGDLDRATVDHIRDLLRSASSSRSLASSARRRRPRSADRTERSKHRSASGRRWAS